MSNIAVITARGGSKRIPRRNIREFCGKPIIAYSIEAAIESRLFDEVMVSTDDIEIADVSKRYGAAVPFFRSKETSDDFATTMDVLNEVVAEYESRGVRYEYLCCLYPTAPFVTPSRMKESFEIITGTSSDRFVPVVRYECPPQWCSYIDESGYLIHCFPEYINMRSQDLKPMYYDAGQFYWFNIENCFLKKNKDQKICTMVLSNLETQDIDNELDWDVAEIKYKLNNDNKNT